MRPVKSYIRTILNESLLDDDDVVYKPANDKKFIEWWINNNCIIHSIILFKCIIIFTTMKIIVKNKNNKFIKYVNKITLLSIVLYYINQIKLFKMAIINYLSIFIH